MRSNLLVSLGQRISRAFGVGGSHCEEIGDVIGSVELVRVKAG